MLPLLLKCVRSPWVNRKITRTVIQSISAASIVPDKSFSLSVMLSLITNMPPEFWPRTIEKSAKFG